ncbi:MAG: PASTA domain-containing protein [Clostridiales Family XIII bacterium]|nr:PASTA domain-containing protein [Clostridiales Family XIII bacterium]
MLALVCAVPVSYFIYAGIQSFSTSKTITVPHLEGYTEEEATEMLEELGLKLAVREIVSSYEVEEGKIVSQDRPAESQLKEGTTVRVNISRGAPLEDTQPDEVRIPNVVGRTLEEATHILNTYGYQEGAVSHAENSLPKGLVVSQNPDANTDAEEGTKVSLTVSDGPPQPKTVLMPNLFRLSEEQAKQQLEKAGLSVGTVTGEPNSIYAEGEVIWQQYEAETEIDPGASVDFKFSTGAPSLEPQTVGINIGFEEAANEVFNLSVLFSDSVTGHTSTLVSEELKYKSDGSVSVSVTGQDQGTLYVLFDGVQVKVYTIDFTTGTVSQ